MSTEVLGTVENGALQLDAALPFPDRTRVRLIVEPVADRDSGQAAWERIKKRLYQRPVHGGGERFSRDQLHERR